jgi:uncharacterized protein (DUF433 family)
MNDIDWSECADIERVSGRVSGQWTVAGARILASRVTETMDYATAEEIDDMFPGLGVERARRTIDYARHHAKAHTAG